MFADQPKHTNISPMKIFGRHRLHSAVGLSATATTMAVERVGADDRGITAGAVTTTMTTRTTTTTGTTTWTRPIRGAGSSWGRRPPSGGTRTSALTARCRQPHAHTSRPGLQKLDFGPPRELRNPEDLERGIPRRKLNA